VSKEDDPKGSPDRSIDTPSAKIRVRLSNIGEFGGKQLVRAVVMASRVTGTDGHSKARRRTWV
jgi:hypothetical protein